MPIFTVSNSAVAAAAAPVKQPTGSAVRTMLQIAAPTAVDMKIISWTISFDGFTAALPIQCEFFSCTGAATMSTALAAADVTKVDYPGGSASGTTYSTALTAFATGAVTEGTAANVRMFDSQLIAPTGAYFHEWSLGTYPVVLLGATNFLRVRVTAGTTVNCYTSVTWLE